MAASGGRKVLITVLGAVAGLAMAVLLQQAGVVPLDRLAAFGLPAVVGGASLTMVMVRSRFARSVTEWVAITIVVLLVIVAATGIPAVTAGAEQGGSQGFLNGGCTVEATSDLDTTSVVDTSRSDPFDIDPDGTVSWTATSPGPIMNHTWEIWVDIAGFQVTVADGGDDNPDGDTDSVGSEAVRPYADDVAGVIGGDPVGIFLVGGDISGEGGACDGQAWVRIDGSPFSNLAGQGSSALLVLLLVIIVVLVVRTQRTLIEVTDTGPPSVDEGPPGDLPPGAMQ